MDKAALRNLIDWYTHVGVSETITSEASSKTGKTIQSFYPRKTQSHPLRSSQSSLMPVSQKLEHPQATSLTAQELVKQAASLSELRKIMMEFEGCALKKTATHMVFGDGNPNADVMLVGEAPGADEDIQGLPFVGRSGKLLDLMFEAIELDRKTNLYISNIIPWRPPGNRQPTSAETTICLPFIQRHIELVCPKYLIFLGGVAAKTLMNSNEGIMRLRGKWVSYSSPGLKLPIKAMPIYHPAYLLRSPGQKRRVWYDLLTLKLELESNT